MPRSYQRFQGLKVNKVRVLTLEQLLHHGKIHWITGNSCIELSFIETWYVAPESSHYWNEGTCGPWQVLWYLTRCPLIVESDKTIGREL